MRLINKENKGGVLMKKLVAFCIAMLTTASICTSCAPKEVEQTNETLTVYIDNASKFKLNMAVSLYKTKYPDVDVIVQTESESSDMETLDQEQEQLATELMSGEGPDVFISKWNAEKMVKEGIYADLEPFFQADSFDWSSYNTTVMDAGVWDGKRYVIPLEYGIPLLLSTEEILDEVGFDPDNCDDFYGFMEETQKIMDDPNQTRTVFRQSWTVKWFPNLAGIDYLDYENESVDLSWDGWEDGLNWCKDNFLEDQGDYQLNDNAGAAAIRDGKCVFEYGYYNMTQFLSDYGKVKTFGTPALIPIRNVNGGLEARILQSVAVRANSSNLQNAYNFIKVLLSPELHNACIENTRELSVLNEANLPVCNNWKLAPALGEGTYGFTESAELTDKDIQQYLSFINEVDHAYYANSVLVDEMYPYFYEDVPYEEALDDAVKQVELYLSE